MIAKYRYVKSSIKERKDWVESLKNSPCADCGKSYPPYVMHWHHIDPSTKKFNIGQGTYRNSRKKILEEISKCVLLCANCHAIREHDSPENHCGRGA